MKYFTTILFFILCSVSTHGESKQYTLKERCILYIDKIIGEKADYKNFYQSKALKNHIDFEKRNNIFLKSLKVTKDEFLLFSWVYADIIIQISSRDGFIQDTEQILVEFKNDGVSEDMLRNMENSIELQKREIMLLRNMSDELSKYFDKHN